MNSSLPRALASSAALLVALGVQPASCAPRNAARPDARAAALKELRDSGAITPQEYAQRLMQLHTSVAFAPPQAPFGGARRSHLIQDPQMGLVASQVVTPADWRFEGAASHSTDCSAPTDTVSYRTESPEGAYGVELQGGYSYGITNSAQLNAMAQQRGCIVFGGTVTDFLARVWAPRMRPGAQIEEAGAMADGEPILQEARRQVANVALPPSTPGFQGGMYAAGARMRLRYMRDGKATEESVETIGLCSITRSQTMMGPQQVLQCTAAPVLVKRAPEGRLAEFAARSDQIVAVSDNPGYRQALNQAIAQRGRAEGAQIAANGQAALAQTAADNSARLNGIIANNNAAIDNIHRIGGASMAAAQRSSDALHQSSQAYAEHMGDQATYDNGYGGTFTGSNQYAHTYVDGQGHAMQTNSAYAPGPEWTESAPH